MTLGKLLNPMISSSSNKSETSQFLFTLLFFLTLNGVFFAFNAFRAFNFYDMCFNLDGGWRILNGQVPYRDFIYFSGPLHLYLNALFFTVFGFGKMAIWAHLTLITTLVMTLIFWATRRKVSIPVSLLLALLAGISFYWPISHPWHNQTADLFGIIGFCVVIRFWESLKEKHVAWLWLTCGFLTMLSFFTKTNTGIYWGFFFLGSAVLFPTRSKNITMFIVGNLVGIVLITLILNELLTLYFDQMLAYTRMMGPERLLRLLHPLNWLTNYFWMPFLVSFIYLAVSFKKFWQEMIFVTILFVTCLLAIFSSDIVLDANIFLWGIFMTGVVVMFPKSEDTSRLLQRVTMSLVILITLLMLGRAIQFGFLLKVWTYTGKNPVGTHALKSKPLNGWYVDGQKGVILDDMVDFLRTNTQKEDSILVVTDMQILYALTGHDSYRGIPIFVMQANNMPVPGKQVETVRKHIQENLPQWIVTDIGSFMNEIPYLGLTETMQSHYTLAQSFKTYAIFRRK